MRTRALALVACLAVLAPACAVGGPGPLEFGIRRLALDLAFVDEDASPPPEPRVIVRLVPAPAEVLEPDFDFDDVDDIEPPDLDLNPCPKAPADATIGLAAAPSVIDPPEPGTYVRRNSGFIEFQGASLPLRFPYPFISAWEIGEAQERTRPGPFGTEGSLEPATQFTVTKALGPEFVVKETFEIGGEALLLLEREIVASGVTTRFRTDPPLEFFRYGAEGDSWTSAGADTENRFGVVIQADIVDREVIDVCGKLVDTFAIAYTEQVVNLANGQTSGTNETEPSTIYFAPQFGGLVVREDMHILQRTEAPDGSPLVIRLDYVSTIMGVEPAAL